MRIILGVAGGIAAYKAALLLRLLREAGHDVRVVPTPAALEFVGAVTWEALSGRPVTTSVFEGADAVEHVRIGREADLVVVAPATADLLARAAAGLADDLLTATLLTATCPVLMAPAMHTEMWHHPATVANVATLRDRGVHVLDPDDGRLTGADSGPGRLPEPEAIAAAALALVEPPAAQDLAGRRVVVSAGGTREPLDPVRFLGNRSSGRQGVAIATDAARRGADVTLVAANVDAALLPDGVEVVTVETTAQLQEAMTERASTADVLVMAAAVADYRPAAVADAKVKKSGDGLTISLVENPDVLAGLVAGARPGQVVVGFAAETGDEHGSVLDHGRAKARRKGADLLAVNAVGAGTGFGDVPNAVVVLDAAGEVVTEASGSKTDVARGLLDAVVALLARDADAAAPETSAAPTTLPR
ncbi:MAG TPA: bifunctional phosphopantothenoylcysteine decarboxylase/phosphopantothenate--cysteine ligase CoaBC [Actinotalea caeni]|uniref:bifunctional phosphopantothenoylcysteine decarboxylase/phosphopantothenate--cysteine ligase CoaBC n=1 Tax=Actinotalea caeni TaxID=1348467 RepID=UPI002B4AC573|nr:bifunctional phosphopantothenoylcysteine decarboxylase/phosphopantothenate--cysteine ligase CoaBC [Actinotalea caeni]HLV56532.1 bifunctional phosphopantothenoylcysteine decarboxylase/phosphopantothenate--cysteine ligase CoaBC [Actinotalea caeni]